MDEFGVAREVCVDCLLLDGGRRRREPVDHAADFSNCVDDERPMSVAILLRSSRFCTNILQDFSGTSFRLPGSFIATFD